MNAAINAALIAAAASKEPSEEKIVAKLRAEGATDPASAIAFDPAKKAEQRLLEKAIANGMIARTADGRVYLDERAIADRKQGQGFMVLVVVLIAASLIASGVALAVAG